LLEAMQERQVTAGGQRHALPQPFFVLATQNPIEQEGTYPLPEAQLDRFMFYLQMDYPNEEEELEVVLRTTGNQAGTATPTVTAEELVKAKQTVRDIAVTEGVARYALRIARWSRPKTKEAPKLVQQYVAWGAGPRASQYLVLCGKARAALAGRAVVGRADVEAVATAVLKHRIRLNFSAQADAVTSDQIIQQLFQSVREHEDDHDKRLAKAFRSSNP
jgi:MoxR-like ATPase